MRLGSFLGLILAVLPPAKAAQDLLVGSWGTHSIRRYSLATGQYLGDFVTPGSGGLNVPDGMDWGPDGNLWVSSSTSNSVLRYDGQSGEFLGAFATGLNAPGNLKFGPDGLLYVCNKNTGQVLRFDPADASSREVFAAGGGLQNPVGLLWRQNTLYVSDFAGRAIRRFDATSGAPLASLTTLNSPLILNLDKQGNLLVSLHQADSVRRLNPDTGASLGSFTAGGTIDCPVGHLFAPDGSLIVASWQNNRLLRYDGDSGAFIARLDLTDPGLVRPNDLLLTQIPEPAAGLLVTLAGVALVRRC